MSNALIYREKRNLIKNFEYAIFVISFDEQTICPKNDKENALNVCDFFQRKVIEIITSDEYYQLLENLINDNEDLTDVEVKAIKKEYEDLTKARRIPNELRFKGMEIMNKSSLNWENARETLDFALFEENLSELIDYYKECIKYQEGKYHGYDCLLDDMEDDFTMEKYDEFFNLLETDILPLVKKILTLPKKYNTSLRNVKFDIDKQKKLTKKVCELMGYTADKGYIGETIHPFTNGININDVRTTTRYDENLLFSNLYSVMHEIGHALYELQIDPKFNETALAGGTSCAIHESQSRFYENYLGRSREFIEFLYPILLELFPIELKDYTVDDIYYYCNDCEAQFTRTEADELTYPFHVLIRYKVEKMLFNNEISSKEINDIFNKLMNEYLGIMPSNKKEGCFQDVHWTSGFGYFPTYALGSAISAQIYYYVNKDIDIACEMKNGNFTNINLWLKNHVHHLGSSMKNMDVIKFATGEDFNPKYYIDYLKNKFKTIYNL